MKLRVRQGKVDLEAWQIGMYDEVQALLKKAATQLLEFALSPPVAQVKDTAVELRFERAVYGPHATRWSKHGADIVIQFPFFADGSEPILGVLPLRAMIDDVVGGIAETAKGGMGEDYMTAYMRHVQELVDELNVSAQRVADALSKIQGASHG